MWAAVPAALLLGLPVAPPVDVQGLAANRVVTALEPQRLVALMGAPCRTEEGLCH